MVDLINTSDQENEKKVVQLMSERFEKTLVRHVTGLREEVRSGDTSLRDEMKIGDAALREVIRALDASLRKEIFSSKTDTIKWMFIFWIGQIGAILGILFAFFK